MLRKILFCVFLISTYWSSSANAQTDQSFNGILKMLGLEDMFKNLGNGTSIKDLENAIKSIDFKKLLETKEAKDMINQMGIDPKMVETLISNINMTALMSGIDVEKIINSMLTGNTTNVMKLVSENFDFSKIMQTLDITNILKTMLERYALGLFPNVSKGCEEQYNQLMAPFRNVSMEAALPLALISPLGKYIDSWAKLPPRILLGNLKWLGAFDECKSIPNAKYCLTGIKLFNMDLLQGMYGSCIPNKCTFEDSFKIMKSLDKPLSGMFQFTFPLMCEKPLEYSTGYYCTIVLCSILLVLCAVGTVFALIRSPFRQSTRRDKEGVALTKYESNGETITENSEEEDEKAVTKTQPANFLTGFLSCFDLIKNTRTVLSTDVPNGAISSINGIRAISMMWIILGHTYYYGSLNVFDNMGSTALIFNRYSFLPIGNAYVSVDTFFLLSGLLVAYLALRRMDKAKGLMKINLPMFYLHRFIRLTPPYMFVILLWNNIFPMMVTGPLSGFVRLKEFKEPCRKYWWTNLLYINNFYPKKMSEECLGWSWYLANDMQFYVAAPFILLLIHFFDRKYENSKFQYFGAYIVTIVGCLLCFIINASLYGANDYPALISAATYPGNPRGGKISEAQDTIYIKPYTRIAPYLIGLFLGYVLSRKILIKFKFKKLIYLGCWLVAFLVAYGVIYGTYGVFKKDGTFLTNAQNIMYGSLHRVAFAICVAWVIYACHNGGGGLIDNFLSWRFWIPLSRLTFGAYLLHSLVIMYYYVCQENPYHYQDNIMVYHYISMVVLSYASAFVLAVTVEYPVMNLEKLVFKN